MDSADSDVVDGLRAALDLERSTTQQLTESLQHEQQRVTHLTAELSRLGDQLTAERSFSARLRNDVDSAVVRRFHFPVFCVFHEIKSISLDLWHMFASSFTSHIAQHYCFGF